MVPFSGTGPTCLLHQQFLIFVTFLAKKPFSMAEQDSSAASGITAVIASKQVHSNKGGVGDTVAADQADQTGIVQALQTTNSLLADLLRNGQRQEHIARFSAGLSEVNAHATVHMAQQMDHTYVAHDASPWMPSAPVSSTDAGVLAPKEGVTPATSALPWTNYKHIDFGSNFDVKAMAKPERSKTKRDSNTKAPTPTKGAS